MQDKSRIQDRATLSWEAGKTKEGTDWKEQTLQVLRGRTGARENMVMLLLQELRKLGCTQSLGIRYQIREDICVQLL
jgi:hypothetical protein